MGVVDFKKGLRKFKLSIINGEKVLKIIPSRFDELNTYLEKLNETFGDYILTGSACLYIYGLLDRLPNDYDIYIKKSDSDKYTVTHGDSYNNTNIIDNRLGYVEIAYQVKKDSSFFDNFVNRYETIRLMSDVFLIEDNNLKNYYEKYNNIKFDSPFNVINQKEKMEGHKNIIDLNHILN